MHYEPVIGLEIHAQLRTRSKMFCRCSADYAGAEPNTHICPICAGFPGVLPVINDHAVELALRVGLALGCDITPVSRFDRKNYHYPDLPKGYQISQYDLPLATNGRVTLGGPQDAHDIGIVRVHMEEDTGKSLHRRGPDGQVYTLVDLNRSGVPLLEIVSAPDIRSAAEAREFATKLRQILRYIEASSGNMEEGALRVDANVSVRPVGQTTLGEKVEIKNMNSFRSIERALDHEIRRQSDALARGERVTQETRGWDEALGVTLEQRTKEFAHDYRYFPEPDLPPLTVSEERRQQTLAGLAELPDARLTRFVEQYGLAPYDAEVLTTGRDTADYYEAVLTHLPGADGAKLAANWVLTDLFRLLKHDNAPIAQTLATPPLLAELLGMLRAGEVNPGSAREILAETHRTGRSPRAVAAERGLAAIGDSDELAPTVQAVLERNPRAVSDYRSGKRQALAFLIGQTMEETKNRAKADSVRALLLHELESG
jgi:aspartyl-tRNA(Asn)/glutamyl-tRNA(Gln) amidotransferase subunit B